MSRPDEAREVYFRNKYGEYATPAEYRWFAAGWDAAIDAVAQSIPPLDRVPSSTNVAAKGQ